MKSILIAIQLLTRFTFRKDLSLDRASIAASMAWFPVAGIIQGAILVSSYTVLSIVLPPVLVAALLVAILALTNGGLHYDGFADTVDAIAGGDTPARRLEIMKDSSVGAIGAAWLVILILLKFAGIYVVLGEAPIEARRAAIFLFPIVGRWAMVPIACALRYARETEGLGSAFAKNSLRVFVVATFITFACVMSLSGVRAVVPLVTVWLCAIGAASYFKKKLGGFTGDVLGFASEAAEVIYLISFVAFEKIYNAGLTSWIDMKGLF